jgi:hypothetical protein
MAGCGGGRDPTVVALDEADPRLEHLTVGSVQLCCARSGGALARSWSVMPLDGPGSGPSLGGVASGHILRQEDVAHATP